MTLKSSILRVASNLLKKYFAFNSMKGIIELDFDADKETLSSMFSTYKTGG